MFDENKTKSALISLSFKKQIVFAASCCERLLPCYFAFSKIANWGNPTLLEEALDKIWELAKTEQFLEEEIKTLSRYCEASIPDSELFSSPYTYEAQNAGSAIIYTLDFCIKKEISLLGWVARVSWEAVEMYLQMVNAPTPLGQISDSQFDKWILTAPLLLAEIQYQQENIKFLSETELDNTLIDKVRHKSSKSGIHPQKRGLL